MPELPPRDYVPPAYEGPTKAEVLALRSQFLTPALVTYFRENV